MNVTVLPVDLSKSDAADYLFRETESRGLTVELMVNNAGFGIIGPFHEADPIRLRDLLQVNIFALTELTHRYLPIMVKHRRGWILNVASLAGFQPTPLFTLYAASKAFVRSFSAALSAEVRGYGVTVTCLSPGPTATGFGRVAGYKHPNRSEFGKLDAATVARAGYIGLMKGQREVVPGGINRLIVLMEKIFPDSLILKTAFKVMKRRIGN